MSLLSTEGYRPEIDSDGDIYFKHEGNGFYITSNCDEHYFYLFKAGTWSIDSSAERAAASIAAHNATRQTKVAKAYFDRDMTSVRFSAESFIEGPSASSLIVARSLRSLDTALDNFRSEMRRLQ